MEKLLRILFLFFFVLVLGIICTSCKDEDNPASTEDQLVGTWVLTKLSGTIQGQTFVMTPDEANMHITLIFRSDKTFQITQTSTDSTGTETGTWRATDNEITAKSSDGTTQVIPYTLISNKLSITMTMEEGGVQFPVILEFTRQ